jgi:hypothetical protein
MTACGVCGESKNTPHSCTVYTAQFLDATSKKTGFKQYTITTRYGDIKKHTYDVCRHCYIKWNFVLPLAVYLISAVFIKIAVLPNEGWDAALFLALFPAGIIVWKYISLPRKLIREALSQGQGFGKYKGFTSFEYQLLKPSDPL